MNFTTGAQLLELCKEHSLPISQVMLRRECALFDTPAQRVLERMGHSYDIMRRAARQALEQAPRTMGGLIGGGAKLVWEGTGRPPVCGDLLARATAYAMSVLEVNASMGLIVAAPTAGSSGVLPGSLLAVQEEYELEDGELALALLNAGAVGFVITANATVAGAEGGCQAEVGAASAMAASAVTELMGGSPQQCLSAAALALSNLLGLVCDPVAGLVEAPCQGRNTIGTANALVCAQLSLCGLASLIPFDEMVDAMLRIGHSLPEELRETAKGGCAATPTGCTLCGEGFFAPPAP